MNSLGISFNFILLFSADVISNISIESSSDYPTAGENFILTCSVVSDTPVVIEWLGPDGEHATSAQLLRMIDRSLSIFFLPLHTSHGGNYTCVASIVSSVHVVEQQCFITVQSKWRKISFNIALHALSHFVFSTSANSDDNNSAKWHCFWKHSTVTCVCCNIGWSGHSC